jgi:quercetin dioxygenase-like cupin family protein
MINIASILADITYGETTPSVSVLLNTVDTKEVRIVFRVGQEMKEHKAPYPIVVAVIEGTIDFGVGAERFILEKGMMIALEANIAHDLSALENSIVRLSLNKSDSLERLQKVINN